jgi:hypothetical protein
MMHARTEHETRHSRQVGRNIQTRRTALGLTQRQLAERVQALGLRMVATNITKIETGRTGSSHAAVTVDQLMAFAQALGCEPMALLTEPACAACHGAPPPGYTCNDCGITAPKDRQQ